MSTVPTFFISAGEASGERYGALLIAELRRKLAASGSRAEFIGMGGPGMAAAGLDAVVRAEDMAVMGFTEVVRHLPRIYGEFQKLKRAIRARHPDVAVLIDFPEIHFRLAKEFHRLGVPVVYFVSPQLWAWKQHRIRLVKEYVQRMAVIFPFEERFYRERGVDAEFIGHPLAELPLPAVSRADFAAENNLDPAKTWIGLLPGSRPREIAAHLPVMFEAARALEQAQSGSRSRYGAASHSENYQFIVPLAPTLSAAQREDVARQLDKLGGGLAIRLSEDARATLMHARASVVASGTATVEAALVGNPFVAVYRVSPVTYTIAKRVVKVPHVAMVNLIGGERVVPELIQNDFTAANIVQQIEPLLPDGCARQSMMEKLAAVRHALRRRPANSENEKEGAIQRVAAIVLEELQAAAPAERLALHTP